MWLHDEENRPQERQKVMERLEATEAEPTGKPHHQGSACLGSSPACSLRVSATRGRAQ